MSKDVKCPNCGAKYEVTVTPKPSTSESNYIWLFDNGHGGIIDGVYQTSGKRSPLWPDGEILYEGEFNRGIVNRLMKLCTDAGIDKANYIWGKEYNKDGKPCIYVSIHANGFSDESANGWSVYTSEGETKSDLIASVLLEKATAEFPDEKMRGTKEEDFYVLRKTAMPAILSENFFMTNSDNCHKYLLSEDGRDRITKIHFEMIQEVESKKLV